MIVISIIAYNVVKKSKDKPLLERTMSIDPNAVVEQSENSTTPSISRPLYQYKPCVMATILRLVGAINAFAGIILGLVCGNEFGIFIGIAVVFSGLMGCLFCLAFAKCVDAAHEYLNRK